MENFEDVNCIICDGSDLHKVTSKGQFNIPTNICICKNCGLSFLSPRWTEERYLDFYANEYDKLYRPNVITQQYKPSPKKDPYSYYPILKRLKDKNFISDDIKKVLDIGSGSGQKLEIFKSLKQIEQLFAIEPSKNCYDQLKARNIEVITNDIDSDWSDNYNSSFDLIIMRHVLEHFMNPLKVLQKLRPTLSDDGIIYIAVPNSLILKNRQLLNSYFRVVHTYYFNIFTIENLVHKAGFEILDIQEGDNIHGLELFLIIKPYDKELPVKYNSEFFEKQKLAYEEKMEEEENFSFQMRQFLKNKWDTISRIKKSYFPKKVV